MIQLALCDDNIAELSEIKTIVHNYFYLKKIEVQITCFTDSLKLLDCTKQNIFYDIYILDIIMPELNGVLLSKKLREYNVNSDIIFLTISEDYALKAYSVFPLQYLLKPVQKSLLFQALDKGLENISYKKEKHTETHIIKTPDGFENIPLYQIACAELTGHSITYHLADGNTIRSSSIRVSFDKIIAPLLKNPNFVKVHKSFVVNLSYIQKLTAQNVLLTTKQIVPISRAYNKQVKKLYISFTLQNGKEDF